MTKVEMTIKAEKDGYNVRGVVSATKDATDGEWDIVNLIANALQRYVDGLEAHMKKRNADAAQAKEAQA